jgi:catechol 2,3-dioxygenase-like lactoylglutathione lyase family enzyme
MEQRLTLLIVGVKDFPKMRAFYEEKFGWRPEAGNGHVVFYKLNGFMLGLFGESALAEDACVPSDRHGFKAFSLAQNFTSIAEVDRRFAELTIKGVRILKTPQQAFWGGYSGYVADPEGNLWELAYNPFMTFDDAGNVLTHASIGEL